MRQQLRTRAAADVAAGLALALCLAAVVTLAGCDNVERAPQFTPASADTGIVLDVPQIMRGTIAAETVIRGYPQAGNWGFNKVVVRGYGLVVGLPGTGSRSMPPDLRAHMLAEMARQGVGSERYGAGHLSPERLLDSPGTTVVIVEAVVPPGAVKGTRFDVRVYADPHSGATSLEGGQLYTTQLKTEPGALTLGRGSSFAIAEGRGTIFINPFAEPGADGRDTVNRTVGRILNGGIVTEDMAIKLRLVTPSHNRAAIIQSAINTRFPTEPGQRDPTARGESEELIAISIPPSYVGRTDEFVALLQHTTIRSIRPESVAMTVRRALLRDPATAAAASLRWQALGKSALPIIRQLYDHAQELPRLAALSAGAKLDDAMVIPPLLTMAHAGSPQSRIQAIDLLAGMRLNPRIDAELRQLLDDTDPEVRLTAYEALVRRRDPYLDRYAISDKFILDVVESKTPMVYITQRGQPRIVVFGKSLSVDRPLVMSTWSDRLMLKGDLGQEKVELYYRGPDELEGQIQKIDPAIVDIIQFMGHTPTPEAPQPGLGLTYAETVGAVHQIWSAGNLAADFQAEQDRILAAIVRQERQADVPDRPMFSDPGTGSFSPQGEPRFLDEPAAPAPPASGDAALGGRR